VPVEVINVPYEYLVSSEVPQFVKVVLRGKDEKLALINEEKITAYIDLDNSTKEGVKSIVRIDKQSIPQRVAIKEINPRIIEVRIEKALTKVVKVIPVIVADLPYGYDFEDVIVEPGSIEIRGPESLVNQIESVYTKEINVKNLTETTVIEVSVDTADEKIELVNESLINVKVIIRKEFVVKKVEGINIYPVNLKEGFTSTLQDVDLTVLLKIPKKGEKQFRVEQVYIWVDCENIDKPGTYTLPLLFKADSDDTTLVKLDPPSIEIQIKNLLH